MTKILHYEPVGQAVWEMNVYNCFAWLSLSRGCYNNWYCCIDHMTALPLLK